MSEHASKDYWPTLIVDPLAGAMEAISCAPTKGGQQTLWQEVWQLLSKFDNRCTHTHSIQ